MPVLLLRARLLIVSFQVSHGWLVVWSEIRIDLNCSRAPIFLNMRRLAGFGLRDVVGVALRERGAVQLVEVADLERVEEVPVVVVLDALHELVADPDRGVGGAGAAVRVAGVLTQVEELGEVEVPVLHVEAEGAELLAAAADRAQHRVDGVHERDRAGATSCCSSGSGEPCERSLVTERPMPPVPLVSHMTSRTLLAMFSMSSCISMTKQLESCGNAVPALTRVEPAARYSRLRHLVVELERVAGRVGLVEREAHGDAHPEVLRNLERVAVARLDAVAVVEGDDADVLEQLVVRRLEGGGEAVEVVEVGEARVEQQLFDAALDGGAEVLGVERLELFGGLVVAEHALVDGLEQQACRDHVELRGRP